MKKLVLILFAFCLLTGANWFDAHQSLIVMRRTAGGGITAPNLSTATIASNGTTLTLAYDKAVTQGSGYNDSDIDLDCTVNGDNVSVTYSSGNTTSSHVYTISETIYQSSDETCTLDFNGDTNSLESGDGEDLAAISDRSMTNNSSQAAPTCDDSSSTGFLVYENGEGTGFDNPFNAWEDIIETVDEDNTTSPMRGAQHIHLTYGAATARAFIPFTSSTTVYGFFRYKVSDATPADTTYIFLLLNGETEIMSIRLYPDGNLLLYVNETLEDYTDVTLSSNTEYHIFFRYSQGTGANGVAWIEVGNSSFYIPTGSGTGYASTTVHTATSAVTRAELIEDMGDDEYYDQILIKPAAFTEVCQ